MSKDGHVEQHEAIEYVPKGHNGWSEIPLRDCAVAAGYILDEYIGASLMNRRREAYTLEVTRCLVMNTLVSVRTGDMKWLNDGLQVDLGRAREHYLNGDVCLARAMLCEVSRYLYANLQGVSHVAYSGATILSKYIHEMAEAIDGVTVPILHELYYRLIGMRTPNDDGRLELSWWWQLIAQDLLNDVAWKADMQEICARRRSGVDTR